MLLLSHWCPVQDEEELTQTWLRRMRDKVNSVPFFLVWLFITLSSGSHYVHLYFFPACRLPSRWSCIAGSRVVVLFSAANRLTRVLHGSCQVTAYLADQNAEVCMLGLSLYIWSND